MADDRGYQAVVEKIISDGTHGPYAVARSEKLGSITFSLNGNVWEERDWPEPGTYVMLFQVRKKRAGWRAQHGRFFEPSDDRQPATE
ncbi:MAG: hypothetical protein UW07_C0010G0028 [Candidatus Nomurabacteria bacterium GW2011_GWF2_43_8]|uniref:Uncharacterized protein n=3 Tax=Candidatus Nomuraibacteriota TaxID=1752729 RepID=A0A0G1FQB3_9BACT|nr:MAG: hypothetical protein UV76_C0007G0052 [Candidatus Nomurabacteria bacterium GW2011_GWA2_43_15]KKT19458.1 MAG: hypothetical protein UW02_C0009G0011 [Candidatus Nomurabacteria bacterium GW2011_GWB1_43_7]KKT24671.1 MAG: hypothetical protein UW07_C0010G0028 [Candidatus Nomurabacteria bacterium GW2011_GWF2_43_8]